MVNQLLKRITPALFATTLLLTSCSMGGDQAASNESANDSSQQQTNSQQASKPSYPDIKAMVIDILHSKDGMNTLKDTISTPEFKRQAAITDADISAAVEKALQQGQNKSFLADQMKDTTFAAAIVKASRQQMTEVQKQLMKDPEYQKSLLTLMASPEFQQTQLQLLKSPEYRKEVMKIMTEALQEPTFRLLFMDSMKEAVKSSGGGNPKQMGQQKSKDSSSQGNKEEDKGSGSDSDSGGGGDGGSDKGDSGSDSGS